MSSLPPFPFDVDQAAFTDPVSARLRTEDPLPLVELADSREVLLATRYEDVKEVLSDQRLSRAECAKPDSPTVVPGAQSPDMLFNMDPPRHTRLRRLVSRAFTPRSVDALRSRTEILVAELIDRMVAGGRPADLVTGLADPLPGTVICELLGVPPAEREVLNAWLLTTVSAAPHPPQEIADKTEQAVGYLHELIERRRAQPQDDMLTALIGVHDEDGDQLSETELVMTVLTLFGGGQDTTAALLAKSVHLLMRERDQWDRLVADPALVPNAVEELLRVVYLGPAAFPRTPAADVPLPGGTIPAGAAVFAVLHSANRDSAVFTDPDRFDVTRSDAAAHLSFGHGVHFCLGAALARMEMQVAMTALVTRLPDLRLAVPETELGWNPHRVTRALLALPVTW